MFTKIQVFACLVLLVLLTICEADARPARNGKIAFTSDRDGNQEIYVMNPDGTSQVRLTNNSIVDVSPVWSPNGRKIAFASQEQDGSFAIFMMNPDGTGRTRITGLNNPYWVEWAPLSWSPDGTRIAFHDSALGMALDVFIVNLDGTGRQNLTADHAHLDLTPSWSPDGSKILFSRYDVYPPLGYAGTMLHTVNTDGTNLTQLANGFADGWNEDQPDWSARLNKIVYSVNVWDFYSALYVADPDGNGRQLFHQCQGGWDAFGARFSPDGRTVAFQCWQYYPSNLSTQIFSRGTDGTDLRQLTTASGHNSSPSWQPLVESQTADFDGDGRSDISLFRPSDRTWYLDRSTAGFAATQFGLSTDEIAPADYDGDGKTDVAVFRNGTWWMIRSSDGTVVTQQFGQSDDLPVPADFTGDGRDELAVYRSGEWWTLDLSNGQSNFTRWGLATDKPVVADYDGDGRADPAVYRDGVWYLLRSQLGSTIIQFGLATDRPVVADYDGDGLADPAVYRDGVWYLLGSRDGFTARQFGLATDIPVPADYDGDGKTDIAVFREGAWYVMKTSGGVSVHLFGLGDDKPIAATYLP